MERSPVSSVFEKEQSTREQKHEAQEFASAELCKNRGTWAEFSNICWKKKDAITKVIFCNFSVC